MAKTNTNIVIKKFTSNFSKQLYDADIFITSEGYSKFDGILIGTPTMFFSINDHASLPIKQFLKMRFAFYLGQYKNTNKDIFIKKFKYFVNNFKLRKKLSFKSKKYFNNINNNFI